VAEDFDIGPLTWVKDEIDQALKSVLENLDTFAANPGDTSVLKFSQTHLFQVSGALDMVGLQGCKRICSELEKVVVKLEKTTLSSSPATIDVLKQSIQLLDQYLQNLLNGSPDLPLTLYPALKSIADLHGESVTESELFFPDTSIRAPKSLPAADVAEDQLSSLVAKQRAAFQAALVQWLKTSNPQSLETMREALDNVQKVQKQAAQKTLWWLASVFTDVLAQKTIAEQNPVKLLCRQIDQQLRSLSQGNVKPTGNLVRDLLFYIAQSAPLTERVGQVKKLFELESLLPQATAEANLVPVELSEEDIAVFKTLEEIVTNLKDSWSAIAEGGGRDLGEFVAYLDEAVIETQKLGESDLTHLLETLHGVMAVMQQEPEKYNEDTFVEVAASLNLMQDVLVNQQVFAAKAAQEMQTQNQRLQDLLSGGATVETITGLLDEGTLLAMAQQIKDALLIVEQSLDTFFRNPADRAPLSAVAKPLEQVVAAFDMLDMPTATKIAQASSALVTYFNENPGLVLEDAQAQFELMAESLSMLGFFVDDFPRIRPESLEALEGALSRLEASQPAEASGVKPLAEERHVDDVSERPVLVTEADSTKAAVAKKIDPELLDIFVTEAEEVLASVAEHLQALRVNNTDHTALKEVRRGYHTLKGSGRTVGLNALGEIAWAVEKLLNVVIDNELVPSARQLTFIEKTNAAFSGWIAELQETGASEPSFIEWQAEAQALESRSPEQKPAAEAAEVLIGGTRKISRALFNIFLAEAKRHVESMKAERSALESKQQTAASSTLLRAAHTLASNAGSTGFKHLSDLARSLENWLEVYSGEWEAKPLSLLTNVIQSLEDMLGKVEALDEPKRASALLTALRKATENATPAEGAVETATEQSAEKPLTVDDLSLPDSLSVQTEAEESSEPVTDVLPETIFEETQAESADAIQVSSPMDQELLSIFTEEARELVPQIGNELRAWRKAPDQSDHPDALQRALHTLKGSARMAGQSEMGNVVHGMEDRIIRALKRKVTAVDFDDMFQDIDTIGALLEDLTGDAKVGRKATTESPVGRTGNRRAQFLRLRADVLDRLINEAGEVSIARSRMEREMQSFKHFSLDLTESVFRLRNYLRELEIETESQMQSRMTLLQEAQEAFDPLEFDRFTRLQELTRMMAESVNDVSTIQNGLLLNLNETESALQQQSRMNRELQYGLMDVRMVPFSVISERMHRIVRQTAHELNKSVELSIDGESVDIDRSVLDKMGAPLEHLLRNSVGHGIEETAERIKKRKPEIAKVQLKVRRENDEIIITVSDDGAGINLDKVREKAIKNGLIQPDQETSEQSLMAVIFEPGFSTATDITQISGRGVGLDAVRGDITGLGGRIEVVNTPGQGATFIIYLPVTLSVAQVVLVRSAHHLYALPSIMVEQLQKLKPMPLAAAYEAKAINWADREYPIHYFGKLIGEADIEAEQQAYTPILLLRSGTNRIALHVDEIIGNQEVVMKPIGSQLARVPGITGATVMGDGNIVLIVNPVQMANREVIVVSHAKMVAAEREEDIKPTVMVVDDSLTMRKVLSRTLEREGYAVVTAKDGMDGLQILQETKPDIILLDIEMPRMDGFEFARNVRGDQVTAGIPIIMISSRTAEKHQSHAKELGVNAFLGKPVQDDDLLAEINVQLGKSAVSA
jgi:chemosensory pili system protein ChpA (sensor histidine kinase/response regulator)